MAALERWGWDEHWQSAWSARAPGGARAARVLQEHRDRWVVSGDGDAADTAGHAAVVEPGLPRPAVGDWVAVREGGPRDTLLIVALLPRRTRFSRGSAGMEGREQVVAADVDAVWIIQGLDTPVNGRRIERYLAVAWESGASPIVVLTKADLAADPEAARLAAEEIAIGVPVRVASVQGADGLEELAPELVPSRTVALLGPSGVGKSSLVNRLLGQDVRATGAVREGDRRGRHTTTSRQLVRLPGGALLLDTPGMRELQLFDVDEGVDLAFSDIDELAAGCRYRDCAHDAEPGCAVKAAVAAGTLDPDRLASFHELRAEAEWQRRKVDPLARKEEEARVKAMMKSVKIHPKYRR